MVDPISTEGVRPIGPQAPGGAAQRDGVRDGTSEFASQLRAQLEQVSQMQAEADAGVEQLLTGQTDNITGVFTATRKAEVAFTLLMEIRNKLVDAYSELRQMRV